MTDHTTTERLAALVRDFIDPDPCRLDHHGYCQAHSWMCGGARCPHARAREVLADYDAAQPAVVPSVNRAAVPAPAEPFPIWTVWREEQPAYGYFATEDIAKRASINCWEEDEPVCPDYSWRPDGGPGNWELLVGDERAEVYIRRHLVWGGLPQPPRAAVLTEAADWFDGHSFTRFFGHQVATELRRLAGGAAGSSSPEFPDPKFKETAGNLNSAGEAAPDNTETPQGEPESPFQVWPLARVLAQVRCGSQDWTWDEEWADLDRRHVATGYLDKLEQEIRANGITMPVLIGTDGRLWDGHHRLRLAVRIGIGYVPVELTAPAVEAQQGEGPH